MGRTTKNERKYDGTSDHGSGEGAAIRGRAATFQQRPGKPDDPVAGPFWRAGRHVAGSGARQVFRGIQAGDESVEEIHRTFQGTYALPVEKGPAHRGIPPPALMSWPGKPKSLPSKR